MPTFAGSDGLTLHFRTWGDPGGRPAVVLHHGFTADGSTDWEATGVVAALRADGRHVIAPDARGHGASEKPHDPARYGEPRMAADVRALADHLGLAVFDLVGYSMGGIVALLVAVADRRVRRLVVGGIGEGVVLSGGVDQRVVASAALAAALRADDPATIADPGARAFRGAADAPGRDRFALAAQADAAHAQPIDLAAIGVPALVLAGESDPLAAHPEVLAGAIPGAAVRRVPGDHPSTLREPAFAAAIVEFVGGGSPPR